ncbi:acyl-CoA dehydrogenase C-terminal domain-containing protein [Pseudomonas sp. 10B1]|uniref:acyl-CoA dehydrogenase C-terminal domain-containing protein n=1 Tax=unclassified Pseudomonas TaxID=196821 RepID=UPI002AB3FF13|nr:MULTISPECIES: acyl-CoA dehydrogenase C-terminal domain-containing protein [unclassified Pseudomonas]MDY7558989.1 acyl-CoA dehydrogenase C-terminal domain-containing protein [Pseudomonas sp. AB6]MEA9979309.1 acyl-CoA dehydrogenase C-terminal domain-containing protein [Pseudomonas sp. RTS4]MEA9996296.1 acyl-CoA dehydrogenase C-terminal domain-containing protein [Pseudomonas sp. AA4]MEB0086662.1 acyl-CoA dehydrogenase C-terminal domain-containing protein [Pseudomonas sp. RTI1]MEB0124712.1 acyl
MPEFNAPVRDMRFVLHEVFDAPALWARLPALAEIVDAATADAILEEAAKVTGQLIAPLNRSGDEEGAQWHTGQVSTPTGFKQAYATYIEGGWVGLSGNDQFGGMGMPKMLAVQFEEMLYGANSSFALYSALSSGACLAIDAHASEALKSLYLPPMYQGRWAGSMCLTEAHAGTDLGIIRSRAEPQSDGSFSISGSKIFITGGEQDLTENIIHLVLAKLPDAPAGPKGISLFLVPKIRVNADGSLAEPNAVTCGSIEHKMGIKASATCVMNFDGASGWLIGEAHKGLAAMFTMMNYERLSIGIQGIGCAQASYQSAVAYARERIQSRAPTGAVAKDKIADPIIVHPDVRRMLLSMKSMTEGGRAFASYVGQQLDLAKFSDDAQERQDAQSLVALLTPVAKAFFTDTGLESCINGQQVLGGHGYIREWGQEQLVRDVRIAQIYEGTNGIQALDLIGRKVVMDKGVALRQFTAEIRTFADQPGVTYSAPLLDAVQRLENLSDWVQEQADSNRNEIGAASVEYLHLFGYVAYAYLWARMSHVAEGKRAEDVAFYGAKIATAHFYFSRMLPRIISLEHSIRAGSESLYGLTAEQF